MKAGQCPSGRKSKNPSDPRYGLIRLRWLVQPGEEEFIVETFAIADAMSAAIKAETGLRDEGGTITEYYLTENPTRRREDSMSIEQSKSGTDRRDQLF